MEEINNNNIQIEFKTSTAQRKAYKTYISKQKDNKEFMEKRKQQQKRYYEENKIKIIARVIERRKELKCEKELNK